MNSVRTLCASATLAATFLVPSFALAGGSATIVGLSPTDTVAVGTEVTFTVQPSGFTNPTYKVVDSVGGGVNSNYINSYGTLAWTPNTSDLGDHTITITVTDQDGNSATAAQTIHVVAPTVSITKLSPGSTVEFGNQVTFGLSSAGFFGVQYTIADAYRNSTVSSANTDSYGNFHWTPVHQDIGTHTLVATARDFQGHSATVSQEIVVTGPGSLSLGQVSPASTVHVGDLVTVYATTTGYTSPTFTIADGFSSSLGTSTLAIDAAGKITWTPNANDIGVHIITVTANDSKGNKAAAQVAITVIAASIAPMMAPMVLGTSTQPTFTPTTTSAVGGPYQFTSLLKVGSSGPDVLALQQLLVKLQLLSAEPTGYFGGLTKRALQYFQNSHGVASVGYTGPATRAALNAAK